jgi:hypothetical protein
VAIGGGCKKSFLHVTYQTMGIKNIPQWSVCFGGCDVGVARGRG